MTILFQSHGGLEKELGHLERARSDRTQPDFEAARPAGADVAVDEEADFGYLMPPSSTATDYLPETGETIGILDELAELMIDAAAAEGSGADSEIPPVITYWGQFLDHELTARTDRESTVTSFMQAHPPQSADTVETKLRNARSPRFDLDSVYGGSPLGPGFTPDVATVISGMRHPKMKEKMRIGTAGEDGPLPDGLDPHRDLPRYVQVEEKVRAAALRLARAQMDDPTFQKFSDGLLRRAIIGDNRNDENLVVAQFHLSFLRFHNKAVDFLSQNQTGWIADFSSAQMLTKLHYQWLIVEGYLKGICDPAVVDRLVQNRAAQFFKFRAQYDERRVKTRLGNALPLEFSVAAFRFGHSLVRALYDYNKNFGRPADQPILPNAPFRLLFDFTGGGGAFSDTNRLPMNWIIDWSRFIGSAPNDGSDGGPARLARKIDTELAPPLADMFKELDGDEAEQIGNLKKHLARRNLRRGYNLRVPTGQALHRYLKQEGQVTSSPIDDVSSLFDAKPSLRDFLRNTTGDLHQRTPLWFYLLAEAEKGGGNRLGEVGSWIVAATFIGVLLADPDSALSRGFKPSHSPLRMPGGGEIDSIEKWMKFALVLE